jgi:dTDP-4-amino-4,6-dideoxygalactose transaminase
MEFIPFHTPSIGRQEIEAVTEVLRSGWLTMGPKTREFEKAFAEYIGCKHAVAVSSCTAALHLALDAIGLRPGDEVIVPVNTFTATANVVVHMGGKVVFADTLADGFNIDPVDVATRVSTRTKAIIPVHIAGEPCRMEELLQLAKGRELAVIEDAAHALPAEYRGRRIGAISPLTAFSFYVTKTLTTGEGGMLTTDNEVFARRAEMMRLHGISHDAWKRYTREGSWYYDVLEAGFKYNMTDLQAALGLCQLKMVKQFRDVREAYVTRYRELLQELEEIELPPMPGDGVNHAWHLFIIRLRLEQLAIDRNQFIEELSAAGIGTSVHFIPLHLQPYYARTYDCKHGDFPNAERTYQRCISLPVYPAMRPTDVERVAGAVRRIVEQNRVRKEGHAPSV